jgi:hypothetical protein
MSSHSHHFVFRSPSLSQPPTPPSPTHLHAGPDGQKPGIESRAGDFRTDMSDFSAGFGKEASLDMFVSERVGDFEVEKGYGDGGSERWSEESYYGSSDESEDGSEGLHSHNSLWALFLVLRLLGALRFFFCPFLFGVWLVLF